MILIWNKEVLLFSVLAQVKMCSSPKKKTISLKKSRKSFSSCGSTSWDNILLNLFPLFLKTFLQYIQIKCVNYVLCQLQVYTVSVSWTSINSLRLLKLCLRRASVYFYLHWQGKNCLSPFLCKGVCLFVPPHHLMKHSRD